MPPAGFEPAIPASEQPQTYALDRAATGLGKLYTFSSLTSSFHIMYPYNLQLTSKCASPLSQLFFHAVFVGYNSHIRIGALVLSTDYATTAPTHNLLFHQ